MLVKILECPEIIDGLVILVIVVSSKNFLQPLLDFMWKDLCLYLVFSYVEGVLIESCAIELLDFKGKQTYPYSYPINSC